MVEDIASFVKRMQMQYSFDRDDFDMDEVTTLGYEKGGRDCIACNVAYEDVNVTLYVDVDTKLCLKLVNHEGEGSYAFDVFKTSGFTIIEIYGCAFSWRNTVMNKNLRWYWEWLKKVCRNTPQTIS